MPVVTCTRRACHASFVVVRYQRLPCRNFASLYAYGLPSRRCSGYAGLPCYQCYSGEQCKTEEDSLSCRLFATAGNPLYLSEYWLQRLSGQDPCLSTPAHYRYRKEVLNHRSYSRLLPGVQNTSGLLLWYKVETNLSVTMLCCVQR